MRIPQRLLLALLGAALCSCDSSPDAPPHSPTPLPVVDATAGARTDLEALKKKAASSSPLPDEPGQSPYPSQIPPSPRSPSKPTPTPPIDAAPQSDLDASVATATFISKSAPQSPVPATPNHPITFAKLYSTITQPDEDTCSYASDPVKTDKLRNLALRVMDHALQITASWGDGAVTVPQDFPKGSFKAQLMDKWAVFIFRVIHRDEHYAALTPNPLQALEGQSIKLNEFVISELIAQGFIPLPVFEGEETAAGVKSFFAYSTLSQWYYPGIMLFEVIDGPASRFAKVTAHPTDAYSVKGMRSFSGHDGFHSNSILAPNYQYLNLGDAGNCRSVKACFKHIEAEWKALQQPIAKDKRHSIALAFFYLLHENYSRGLDYEPIREFLSKGFISNHFLSEFAFELVWDRKINEPFLIEKALLGEDPIKREQLCQWVQFTYLSYGTSLRNIEPPFRDRWVGTDAFSTALGDIKDSSFANTVPLEFATIHSSYYRQDFIRNILEKLDYSCRAHYPDPYLTWLSTMSKRELPRFTEGKRILIDRMNANWKDAGFWQRVATQMAQITEGLQFIRASFRSPGSVCAQVKLGKEPHAPDTNAPAN